MNDSTPSSNSVITAQPALRLAVVGAGPVGLALGLLAARSLPVAAISVFDARPLDRDVAADARTLALSLGSVQLLQRLGAWPSGDAEPILQVHVSQQPASLLAALGGGRAEPALVIRASDEAVPMLGAVLSYGAVVAPLQAAWLAAQAAEPTRLTNRFGSKVEAMRNVGADAVEVDCGAGGERFDLAIVAEGGVFASAPKAALVAGQRRAPLRHDYGQTAWVGSVGFAAPGLGGVAYERFTRHGPVALLPRRDGRAGLVWCTDSADDAVAGLDEGQRLAVLQTIFHSATPRLLDLSPLKRFPLGLSAERTLTDGRTVRIGNAAQTLHPVAGQGLNLGLRDAHELVRGLARSPGDIAAVLRSLEWQRAPDRWSMIAATDFLARSFTWTLPGAGTARGLGLAALQSLSPLKSRLAQQMMFGSR